jgi:eukaryotic-like serine/threonine-protein kinase
MFAGHPPFRGSSPFEVAVQHVQKEPVPLAEVRPDLPADLCTMIHKMMAKQPEARYQTAREIARDVSRLRELVAVAGTAAIGPTLLSGSAEAMEPVVPTRGWGKAALVALIPFALVAGLALGWVRHQGNRPADNGHGNVNPPGHEEDAQSKQSEKELRRLFQDWSQSSTKADDEAVVRLAVDLGMLYLRQKRYDDAEKFFQELTAPNQKMPRVRVLGKLGKGMVLAFQDNYKESNSLFLSTFEKTSEKAPGALGLLLRNSPAVREMLAKALHHNYMNSPDTFPEKLRPYRFPPMPINMQAKKD